MNQPITDDSDFAQTAIPQLTQLDKLLRCHICKEFLRVPVLTPCGHTFCSLCIRQYLRQDPKCPLCLNELRESSLRSEFLVGEIVEIHKSSRQALLDILNEYSRTESKGDSPLIELGSQSDADDDIQILATTDRKSLRPSTIGSSVNRVTKRTGVRSLLKNHNESNKSKQHMAQCPICEQFYPIEALERTHLDECLTVQSLGGQPGSKTSERKAPSPVPRKPSPPKTVQYKHNEDNDTSSHVERYINSSNSGDRQRLPKVTFASMSVAQIKQKLASLGLPVNGTKQTMIARYDQYEMLWNSNFCDAIEPVDVNELKRQLLSWETTQNNHGSSNIGGISSMMKRANGSKPYQKLLADFKNDKFERKSWIQMFRQDFKSLIKEARRQLIKETTNEIESQKDNTEETVKTQS